jgi:hypothetical protein
LVHDHAARERVLVLRPAYPVLARALHLPLHA